MKTVAFLLGAVPRHQAIATNASVSIHLFSTVLITRAAHNGSLAQISESKSESSSPPTHYKITLLRSPISLGSRIKGTLVSLGIHRRMQTVYHPHAPEFAGKILAVKELVAVENVPQEAIRTKTEQRRERKASRGFTVLSGMRNRGFDGMASSQGSHHVQWKGAGPNSRSRSFVVSTVSGP